MFLLNFWWKIKRVSEWVSEWVDGERRWEWGRKDKVIGRKGWEKEKKEVEKRKRGRERKRIGGNKISWLLFEFCYRL